MNRIALRGIRVYGRHGANPGERDVPQPFEVDVELEAEIGAATRSDKLEDTLDYDVLHRKIVEIVARDRFSLLERLAEEIANEALRDARVVAVSVSVAKPGILSGATPSVTVRRTR